MTRPSALPKIDVDATVDEHYKAIRSLGLQYLNRAIKQNLPPQTRVRVLFASLRYLESRSRINSQAQNHSQSVLSQGVAVAVARPDSSFQSLLATLVDHEIPPQSLIDACAKAADCHLLSIVIKCLFVLSKIGPINTAKQKQDIVIFSQTQKQEDEELFGEPDPDSGNPDVPVQNIETEKPSHPNQVKIRRTGQTFVDDFVVRLVENTEVCKRSQTRSNDVFISSLVREAPLSETASQHAIQILINRMAAVDIFELPAFIYQLLLFASARGTPQVKSQVLVSIAEVFVKHENSTRKADEMSQSILAEDEDAITVSTTSLRDLRQVQGTALLHIEYAIKQDPSLSAEAIKLAKLGVSTPRHFMTSFGTGILLSLSRAASVQSDVLQIVRDSIMRFDKEIAQRSENLYMSRVSMNDDELIDPRQSLLHIADCTSENGWDYVKESLLQFAFVLLDKPLPNPSVHDSSINFLAEPLIFKMFNAHPGMRESILEQLTTRITLQEKSALQAIFIIKKLSMKIPYFVLENNRFIRDGIEILVTLPPWMASTLMEAYKPLLVARQDLQDYFQLVVRKSLFHRDISSRAVAIVGFLTIVSIYSASRNINSSQDVSSRRIEGQVDVIIEAIQPLRRIFSYSATLKAFFYKNAIQHLQNITSRPSAKHVAIALGEILQNHLHRFVDATQAPYVLIEHCVDENNGGKLVEPLGDLIWCLAVIEEKRDPDQYSKSYVLDLAKKVASVSLQDFSFTKEPLTSANENRNDTDFEEDQLSSQAAARANRNKVRVLGSVTEATIHAVLIMSEDAQDWVIFENILIPLLLLKGKVYDLLRNAGVASPADAFSDLGGDLGIERLRPGARLFLQRAGKSTGGSKKGAASKKVKSVESGGAIGSSFPQTFDHRFGAFNVLSSASSRPSLSLQVSIRILQMMFEAMCKSQAPVSNFFKGKTESRDFQELRVYLLAVAHKHVDDFISSTTKAAQEDPRLLRLDHSEMIESTKILIKIVMNDFKRFRRSSSPVPGQGGLKALQVADSCICAAGFLAKSKKSILSSFCQALMPASSHNENEEEIIFETAVDALEKLVDTLIDDAMLKEVVVALHIHDTLVKEIVLALQRIEMKSAFLQKRIRWAIDAVAERQIGDAGIVKTLLQTAFHYTEDNNDLRRAFETCDRLLEVMGECDAGAEPSEPHSRSVPTLSRAVAIEQSTSLATADAILDVIDRAISDVDWCLRRMVCLEAASNSQTAPDIDNQSNKARGGVDLKLLEIVGKQAIRAEDAAQVRLECAVQTLQQLARCAIGKWAQQERLLKLVTKTYKTTSYATQSQAKRRGEPRTSFVSLINECKGLAPTLWTYLAFIGADTIEERGGKGMSKAAKEARVMPQLVYEVEKFEKVLIGAQKRTKISLLRGMRRNIARDFRIREDCLQDMIEVGAENEEENNGENMDRESKQSSRVKRRRVS